MDRPRSASPRRRGDALALGVVALLGVLAYANAFHASFHFDDGTFTDNPALRDLGAYLGGGWRGWPTRAVAYLTFALDYRIAGYDVRWYHAVNLAIHLVNAGLVYALVRTAFGTPRLAASVLAPVAPAIAFVAAALFVAHPIQTEAVTYVVQRLASLATTFYVLAVLSWARWRLAGGDERARVRGAAWYATALVAAVAAMETKEIAFTLPAAIALWELSFHGRPDRVRLAAFVPVAATSLIIPLALLGTAEPIGHLLSEARQVTSVQTHMPRADYLTTQLVVVSKYLRLVAWPAGQDVDHDQAVYRSLADPTVLACLSLLVALAALAAELHRRSSPSRGARAVDPAFRLVSFGIAWFFVAISVESSVIPIADVMFEHRVYLPSVGLFAAIATAGAFAARRLAGARAARATVAGGLAVASALAVVTLARNEVWATDVTLWSDAAAKSPAKARPHYNLGLALAAAHREREAIPELLADVRIDPGHAPAYEDLALAYEATGRADEAERWLLADVRLAPGRAEAHAALGELYLETGRAADAVDPLERAVQLEPGNANAYANLCGALNRLRRFDECVRALSGAGATIASDAEARFNLGVAYAALHDRAAAARESDALDALSPPLAARLRAFIAR